MGKKAKWKKRHAQTSQSRKEFPSFEDPVCPACGWETNLTVENEGFPVYTCTRCKLRFMLEQIEDDDETEESAPSISVHQHPVTTLKCAICKGAGCEVCDASKRKKKKAEPDYQTEPLFGAMEELTQP